MLQALQLGNFRRGSAPQFGEAFLYHEYEIFNTSADRVLIFTILLFLKLMQTFKKKISYLIKHLISDPYRCAGFSCRINSNILLKDYMIRVLIADGNEYTLAGVNSMLKNEPEIDVLAYAADGETVLDLIASGKVPDVLLTDVHLPRINGILLAEQLNRNFPFIKAMVFTMEDQEHYLVDAFKSGVKSYVTKSVGREELVFAIRQVHQGKFYMCTQLASRLTRLFLKGIEAPSLSIEPSIEFSAREMEVLQLIADGCTNQEIADKLFTSRRTVEGHRQSMINKTGVRNTPALVKYAMRYNLLKTREDAFRNTGT